MSIVNDSDTDFQVLPALSSESAAKLIQRMHVRGYEHYNTTRGSWDDEGQFSQFGMTLFFRRVGLESNQGKGRAGYRGARAEGFRK